ncbi:phage shock protein A (PspA) family protein [Corynebacterium mustelae]|uniref:Phage shock protein A (PspA) family protein n=1 Tax=Corynebacterium mustelae TaxID=571915 RepID=A0A0G3H821_9CORY|nr:PspA/IM30 family protein [Corynebacterium mustelae]AKK07277.1 phage shock protein A (PspA) family protein [Corynebacterium mustelae]
MSKNPFIKGWKYLTASVDHAIDENADPKVQINQAVQAAKKQHQEISQQAAAVIGNKNQLEMKLDRLVKEQAGLQEKARQAIQLADKATADGDQVKSQEFTSTAEIYATQLVSVEQQLEETKALHAQATQNAEAAKTQVQQSEARLTQQLAEAEQLLRQANQAQMQETATKAMDEMAEIDPDRNVPTLDDVRAKIESRYANALGAQELMENSMGERMTEIEMSGTDMKASARLEEIRAQMRGDNILEQKQEPAGELQAAAPEADKASQSETVTQSSEDLDATDAVETADDLIEESATPNSDADYIEAEDADVVEDDVTNGKASS